MNLRELVIQRILFSLSDEELEIEFQMTQDDVFDLSDLDLFEMYETILAPDTL